MFDRGATQSMNEYVGGSVCLKLGVPIHSRCILAQLTAGASGKRVTLDTCLVPFLREDEETLDPQEIKGLQDVRGSRVRR